MTHRRNKLVKAVSRYRLHGGITAEKKQNKTKQRATFISFVFSQERSWVRFTNPQKERNVVTAHPRHSIRRRMTVIEEEEMLRLLAKLSKSEGKGLGKEGGGSGVSLVYEEPNLVYAREFCVLAVRSWPL